MFLLHTNNLAIDKCNVRKLNNFTICVVRFYGDGSGPVCWQLKCEKTIKNARTSQENSQRSILSGVRVRGALSI